MPVTHEPIMSTEASAVVADIVLDQSVSLVVGALSLALTLKEYSVPRARPVSVYVGADCQPLLLEPSVVHSKKYCTGGFSASVAVVAVIVIVLELVAAGTVAHVIGSGVGGVVSGGLVVADNVFDQSVSLITGASSRALTLNESSVPGVRPVST